MCFSFLLKRCLLSTLSITGRNTGKWDTLDNVKYAGTAKHPALVMFLGIVAITSEASTAICFMAASGSIPMTVFEYLGSEDIPLMENVINDKNFIFLQDRAPGHKAKMHKSSMPLMSISDSTVGNVAASEPRPYSLGLQYMDANQVQGLSDQVPKCQGFETLHFHALVKA